MTIYTRIALVLTLMVASLAHAEKPLAYTPPHETHTHDLSVGFLSHKVGSSLVSYARTLWSNENHELYAGAGTLVALNTAALGWKSYLMRDVVDVYVVGAVLVMAGMSDNISPAPFVSTGIEIGFWDNYFFNGGVNTIARVYYEGGEFYRKPELLVFGQASLSYRW